jgi:hypothetical protein
MPRALSMRPIGPTLDGSMQTRDPSTDWRPWALAFVGVLVIASLVILFWNPKPAVVVIGTPRPPVIAFSPDPEPSPEASAAVAAAPRRVYVPGTPRVTIVNRTPRPAELCNAPYNPWAYNFCGSGDVITDPPSDFCTYFECIERFWKGKGFVVQCGDGMFAKTGGRLITCNRNGGEYRTLFTW